MAKKRVEMSSQAKNRLIVFGPLCVAVVILFVLNIISYSADLYKLQREKSKLEKEYADLLESIDDLKIEITKLKNPEYLANVARENYLYSKDGELIIKVNETKQDIEEQEESLEWNRNVVFISLGVVVFILLYIIFSGRSNKKRNHVQIKEDLN